MNKSLRPSERFSPRARGLWRVSTTILAAIGLMSLWATAWDQPPPPDGIGIQGVINHVCLTSDAYELDDVRGDAKILTAGASQQHSFDGNTFTGVADKDWVRFEVAPGGVYTVTTSGLSALADTSIKLFDANGDPVSSSGMAVENDDAGGALGKGSQIVWTAPSTVSGWYSVAVTNSPKNTSPAFEDCAGTEVRYMLSLENKEPYFLYLPLVIKP